MLSKILKHSVLAPLISSVLLILSYPKFDLWPLIWISLVPLMICLDLNLCTGSESGNKKGSNLFWLGYKSGFCFYIFTVYWLIHTAASAGVPVFLSLIGLLLFAGYLAVYFGIFAYLYGYLSFKSRYWDCRETSRCKASTNDRVDLNLFVVPCIWVCLEFLRSRLFSGFGWLCLGHSQYKVLPLIQIVDITGVFGVSFLVVMVNYLIKELLFDFFLKNTSVDSDKLLKRKINKSIGSLIIVSMFLLIAWIYGIYKLQNETVSGSMKVAIVQGNIEQTKKWRSTEWPGILSKYLELTKEAAKHNPDLIIWPETSYPGFLTPGAEFVEQIKKCVKEIKIPLLIGAVNIDDGMYYNSAVLLSEEGKIINKHDKLHLVPFGEYIPFRKYFPIIEKILPLEDFGAGKKWTLFSSNGNKIDNRSYSVLVCFEDTMPRIARGFVKNGAKLLINITNDAWFLDSNEPLLHMQTALFRAIENRRSLIRVANTGISCFISPYGKIYKYIEDHKKKKTYIEGYAVGDVSFNDEKTFLTKTGDAFTYLCFLCILCCVINQRGKSRLDLL